MRKFEAMKKLLSLLLCAVLVMGMVPVPALAAEGDACISTEGCAGVYTDGVCSGCGQTAPGQDDPGQNMPDSEESQQETPNQNESQQKTPAPEESETDAAVAAAQALIDALPNVESVRAMTYDDKVALYNGAYLAASNAYSALTEEQKAEGDAAKLMALAAFYADPNNLTTADENVTEYGIWIAGVQVTSANASGITGNGITGNVSYNAETNTLTLNNAAINTEAESGIKTNSSLTINGSGTNSIYANTGILATSGDITITGNIGSITATSYHGICTKNGDITISGSVGDIKATTEGQGYGIQASGNIDISGTVGNITAACSGILSPNGSIIISGTVGNVSSQEYGAIHTKAGDITITGTVGTLSSTNSAGIRSEKNIVIGSGCVVDANGLYGIVTKNGTITNNGTLKLPENYKISSLTSENYSGSGIVMVGEQQYIMYNDKWYAYADGSGGIKIESTTPDTYYKAGDGFAVYDGAGKLTLNNATIDAQYAGIETRVALTIEGTGENTVVSKGSSAIWGNGVNVTIQGSISKLEGKNGISANSVTITGSVSTIKGILENGNGIIATNGDVTIQGTIGEISGTGKGIHAKTGDVTISSGATVTTISGGTGIETDSGKITVSGTVGTITGTAGSGIYTQNGIVNVDGTVTKIQGTKSGILSDKGPVTISGTVTAIGTDAGVTPLDDSKLIGNVLSVGNGNAVVYGKYNLSDYAGESHEFTDLTVKSGATLTIPAGETVTVTTSLTNNGNIVNNGTLVLPEGYDLNANLTKDNYSGDGIVMVGTQQYIMYNDKWYAYADGSAGIVITADTPNTYYKTGNGFAVYDKNGTLTLNNAAIRATENEKAAIFTAVDLSITGTGTNTLSAAAASAIYGQKNVTIDGKIASIQGSINGIGAEGTVSIPGTVESISGTTGRGINAKDVAITGTVNSIEGIAGINALNGVTISGSIGTIKGTAGSGIYAANGDVSVEAGAEIGNIQGSKYGICAEKGKLSIDGTITAVSGETADVRAKNGVSIGENGSLKLVNTTGNPNKLSNVTITGGTLYLQDKGYTWNSSENAYRCKDDAHSENTAVCTYCGAILDTTNPTISGVENGKTYYTTQKAIAKDDYLTSVTNGDSAVTIPENATEVEVTLEGNQAASYTVTAKDAVGNEASVTITMKPISTLDDPIENLTVDNVELTDKETIQSVLDAVTDIREGECDNATDAEKDALDAIIRKCEDLLDTISDVEKVIDLIEVLPKKAKPDDKDAVEAYEKAREAYDELRDHEKELVGRENRAKLDKLHKALTAYKITKGDGSKWTKNSSKTLKITANGLYRKFTGIEIDGKWVDAENYTAKSGSTVINLKASYLETLSTGKHTIQVFYIDGETNVATFQIVSNNGNPFTGDSMNLMLYGGVAMTSLLCIAMMIVFFPKKKGKYQR